MNKGFTLVELLAVIIILGAIMLMVIPTVITSVNDASERSFLASASKIIEAAEIETAKFDFEIETQRVVLLPISSLKIKNYSKYDENSYVLVASIYNITTESYDYKYFLFLANDDYVINGVTEENFTTALDTVNTTTLYDVTSDNEILLDFFNGLSGPYSGVSTPDDDFIIFDYFL